MVERFNALSKRNNLDFEAWFNDRIDSDRSWEVIESGWEFRYKYLPTISIAGRRLHFPWSLLRDRLPDMLISLYAEPVFLAGLMIARLRRVRTAIWVEVTFDRWIRRRWWKERLKREIFPLMDGIITVGLDGQAFARRYRAREEKIFYAPHVIDVDHFSMGSQIALLSREKIRQELGLRGVTFIYVGRLWWGKGVKYLLEAFQDLQNRLEDEISLLIVGDGADAGTLKKKCRDESISNVVFTGFYQKSELPKLYGIADVFVFPTLGDPYGLVVDEAMACSLPVVCTSSVGEIRDRVVKGVNGYILPPGDRKALAEHMEMLVHNAELRRQMGEISAQKIAGHTPNRWAGDFERAVKKVMETSWKDKKTKARSDYRIKR